MSIVTRLPLLICAFLVESSLAFVQQSRLSVRPRANGDQRYSLKATAKQQQQEYVRWNKKGDTWHMQTAVTTFQRGNESIELHAQLHFGDKPYFEFYNSQEFQREHQSIHYELLVDEDLLTYENGNWRLKSSIMASPNDQSVAAQYGWSCQVDSIDYTQPKWIQSDLSRQEFLKLADQNGNLDKSDVPLWKLASTSQSSSAAAEAVSALLVGPPALSYSTSSLKRRLFTNLFLPGDSLANNIRALLWLTVPAPELSVMLLDWSSILRGGSSPGGLSPIAIPALKSILNLDVARTRKFLFGQVLTSSTATEMERSNESSGWNLLVTKRNDHALRVLEKSLDDYRAISSKPYSTALLYGSSHCPDLHQKLISRGFIAKKTTWRSAWAVKEKTSLDERSYLAALAAITIFYLGIGAVDWISMMGEFSQEWLQEEYLDSGVVVMLYLMRHVLLYLGLSKVLVDWTPSSANNENVWSEMKVREMTET